MPIIRSDILTLQVTSAEQQQALLNTLALYRRLVRDLMTVAYTHWPTVGASQGNEAVKIIEALIHSTAKRPHVRYTYFANRYYKFPSYLRRVAIMDAVGQVRSFVTRFDQWRCGRRKHPHAKPPRLTASTKTFPSLYGGQCAKLNADATYAFIKVRQRNDWLWMGFRLKGTCRFRGKGKAKSPLLTNNGRQWQLSLPEQFEPPKRSTTPPDRVLAVDVGINTAATWAVVDAQGTVHARGFISRTDKDREYRLMARIRQAAKKHTRHGSRLPPGFCRRDHQRLTRLADNQAHQISRQLVNMALNHGCQAIAVENLKGWRPKAGKKRTPMKARFHRWFHRQLVARIHSKAVEIGLRCVAVYARGTSRQAFDGSGPVKRDKGNYSQCTFSSGKRYHADLNAAYNIAARGHVFFQGRGRKATARMRSQMSTHTPRTPVSLSTLWQQRA
ncbi:IS200/IS605 family accessory protein TnpB-related protein [Vreelandella massiliensis]|uniref:IS200/IS605 family accessory protein TnpB-related protein n=1 Tax=Vreelandella massiliensis TaxID=1816686 RepID=UPI00096A6606|nr:IS200/IS605 family accessory protein TnpB-related protein [Halomonas massiliensis]